MLELSSASPTPPACPSASSRRWGTRSSGTTSRCAWRRPAPARTSSPSTAARAAPARRRSASPTTSSLPFRWGFTACTGPSPSGAWPTARCSSARVASGCPRRRWPPWRSAATWSTSGRTAMFSIGCIQAQRCHTDRCPTGVATQNPRLARARPRAQVGAVRELPGVALRYELVRLSRACGVVHPALVTADQLEVLEDRWRAVTLREVVGYEDGLGPSRPGGPGGPGAADDRHVNVRRERAPAEWVESPGPERANVLERRAWSPEPPAGSW